MTGNSSDIVARLKAVLPTRWFPDQTPVLDALLAGLAAAWTALYAQLLAVRAQSRIATATAGQLDLIAADFFGNRLNRRPAESDLTYRTRIARQLVREHATRAALTGAVLDLTGTEPDIFEPANVADTGAYNAPGFAYGAAGAWGSLALPFQVFVTIKRTPVQGIAAIAGYGTGGALARADIALSNGTTTDADIFAAVAAVMPTATTAWTRISN